MRQVLVILGLTAFAMVASESESFGQWRGGRGGYGGYGGRGGYGGYYGAQRGSGIYFGIGSVGGYSNYGRGYYGPRTIVTTPNYYVAPSAVQTQSFYSGPASSQVATIHVLVPNRDAEVWFGNTLTTQRGNQRAFQSPALEAGYNYNYNIRARWTENGQTVERERRVNVQPGQTTTVDLRSVDGDN